jgi:integrase
MAGLPRDLVLYDLRHTLATRLTQAGVSPLFVAQIIGHSGMSSKVAEGGRINKLRVDNGDRRIESLNRQNRSNRTEVHGGYTGEQ